MILQSQVPAIRTLATAHLAQTMSLLSLPGLDLRQKIEAELATNPALELARERRCPTCRRRLPARGPCSICSRPAAPQSSQPIVFVSDAQHFSKPRSGNHPGLDLPDQDYAACEGLPAYVLRQIASDLEPSDRPLAAHILTSLDEDGLLSIPLLEIARYHHTLPSRVEHVLRLIQRADPAGVGASSPQEALLIQLKLLAETHSLPPLAEKAVQAGMDLLSRRSYQDLGRLLGVPASEAQAITQFIIENLNPYPARAHWGDTSSRQPSPQVYHDPDVIVTRLNDSPDTPLVVEIVSPYAGSLRVNPLFRQALPEAPADKSEAWQAAIDGASLLVKCLQQRDHTLIRLMKRLAVLQRDFMLHGDAQLEPLTRAVLAEELDLHESTISRAVADKAIQLPNRRIVPLSRLFDRSLHIRTALREIIAQETKPLTDTQIARVLKTQGYPIARRTVAKYRAMEGILPAHLRNHKRQPMSSSLSFETR
jgi:RNA polymerase sigma-54 factor